MLLINFRSFGGIRTEDDSGTTERRRQYGVRTTDGQQRRSKRVRGGIFERTWLDGGVHFRQEDAYVLWTHAFEDLVDVLVTLEGFLVGGWVNGTVFRAGVGFRSIWSPPEKALHEGNTKEFLLWDQKSTPRRLYIRGCTTPLALI